MLPIDYRPEALAADNLVPQELVLSFLTCYTACEEGNLDTVQSRLTKDC